MPGPQKNEPLLPMTEVRKRDEPPDLSFTLDEDLFLLDDADKSCPVLYGGTAPAVELERSSLQMDDTDHNDAVATQSGALRSQNLSADNAHLNEALPEANQLCHPSDAPGPVPLSEDCDEKDLFVLRPLFSDSLSDFDESPP
jgi:hypothetical protein